MKVLIVGAKPESLGDAIRHAVMQADGTPITAGINDEDHVLSVTDPEYKIQGLLLEQRPDHVVVTAGINLEPQESGGMAMSYRDHFLVNCTGPMRILEAWRLLRRQALPMEMCGHYVAISSNSAHIARSGSAPYCASKAALSMAVRSEARDLARSYEFHRLAAYTYEPGWLEGTPMSDEVADRLAEANALGAPHRMLGLEAGVSTLRLARLIVHNLLYGGRELNGCSIRIDAGEQ
jgi:NAD(P)-dependent dehydrogenase (short-subunit alcohol dehydrogenase family)